jgi:putative hydrolase of the HAD superfamily
VAITTVLLDVGGVILDESEHEKVRAEIVTEILSEIIPGYSLNEYYLDVEESVKVFCPHAYGYVFWKNLKGNTALFDELFTRHLKRWHELRPPLKLSQGIDEEVKAISRDFKLGIAGQYGKEILSLLERSSILDCFEYHLTQDDFSVTKPDPRYYEQIVKAIGVNPEQCIMVGDRIDKDIIPAKELGMKTIRIRVGLHKNQKPRIPYEIPDVELESVRGLSEAILRLAGTKRDSTDQEVPRV